MGTLCHLHFQRPLMTSHWSLCKAAIMITQWSPLSWFLLCIIPYTEHELGLLTLFQGSDEMSLFKVTIAKIGFCLGGPVLLILLFWALAFPSLWRKLSYRETHVAKNWRYLWPIANEDWGPQFNNNLQGPGSCNNCMSGLGGEPSSPKPSDKTSGPACRWLQSHGKS